MEKDKDKNKQLLEELERIVEEKTKWSHFFEILTRKYVLVPVVITLVYTIDNPDINIIGYLLKFLKRLAGIH